MLKKWIAPVVVASLATVGSAQTQQPDLSSPIKRTPLGKVEVPGSNYEVVFGVTELVPGPRTGRHSHPGIVMAYVAEGEFWYLIDGQPERTYKAGDAFQVPERAVHNEGAVGTRPAKVMAVYVVEKGRPLVEPAAASTQ